MLTQTIIVVRLLISALLCGAIGLEREWKQKPAGLRTHMLVGVGSTLITLTSLYTVNLGGVDPTRIAAGIVTGIGFLGAGLILRDNDGVHGITTASAIWMVAAIGMAVGVGFYLGALVAAAISLATLVYSHDEKVIGMVQLPWKRSKK